MLELFIYTRQCGARLSPKKPTRSELKLKCYNRSSFSITKQIYIIHKNVPSLLQLIFS